MSNSNSPETLGIEFEAIIMPREEMSKLVSSRYFSSGTIKTVTKDASIESEIASISDNTSIFLGKKLLRDGMYNKPKEIVGYELVTNPLSIEDMRAVIKRMCALQARYGEIFSNRASVHVHTGYPMGLKFYKTALAFGLKVEPLFFKIAGLGRPFRGTSNSMAYCKPLALPPAMSLSDATKLAILDPVGAVNAEDLEDFWNKLGIKYGDRNRYSALRYFAINVFSIMLRGTLEFRFFNFCSDARYVEAATCLSQTVSDIMQRISLKTISDTRSLSIFEENSNTSYNTLLDEILYLSEYYNVEHKMDSGDVYTLRELIEVTPQPFIKNITTASHIKTSQYPLSWAKSVGLRIIDSAPEPGIVDIHTFEQEERSLLEDE